MGETKKRCPYCGEEIMAVAKKCKHCGSWLDESTKPLQERKETQKLHVKSPNKTLKINKNYIIIGIVQTIQLEQLGKWNIFLMAEKSIQQNKIWKKKRNVAPIVAKKYLQ